MWGAGRCRDLVHFDSCLMLADFACEDCRVEGKTEESKVVMMHAKMSVDKLHLISVFVLTRANNKQLACLYVNRKDRVLWHRDETLTRKHLALSM